MNTNPYAPPAARVDDVSESAEAPAIWNPSAAARWSLLFTPVFGAALHMKNWQALGEPEKAAQAKGWLIGSVLYLVAAGVSGALWPDSRGLDVLFRGAGLGLLIAWYTLSARAQARYVTGHYGTTYPRKGWARPLLYALAIIVAVIVIVFSLAFAIAATEG